MTGYGYGDRQPTQNCPYCGAICYADFVDIGVGYTQCGPFHCEECFSSEIGPYDKERNLTEEEKKCGWYKPHSEPGSSANVIDGKIVGHRKMKSEYESHFVGNPLYHIEGYVEEWFEQTRKTKE